MKSCNRDSFFNAVDSGDNDEIKRLYSIDNQLCEERDENGDTVLTLASGFGKTETVKLLIEDLKVNINSFSLNGQNCFLRAAHEGKHNTMRYLHSVDLNLCKATDREGNTALILASKFGLKETVELMIKEFDANIQEIDASGRNCFLVAAKADKVDTIRYLYSIDKTLCKRKDEDSNNVLTLASEHASAETVKLLIQLCKYYIDIDEVGFNGRNCIHCAVVGGKPDTIRYLHSINKNLYKAKDANGDTALTLARIYGFQEIEKLLTEEFGAEDEEPYDTEVFESDYQTSFGDSPKSEISDAGIDDSPKSKSFYFGIGDLPKSESFNFGKGLFEKTSSEFANKSKAFSNKKSLIKQNFKKQTQKHKKHIEKKIEKNKQKILKVSDKVPIVRNLVPKLKFNSNEQIPFDEFKNNQPLGKGGMSRVFEAYWEKQDIRVALKVANRKPVEKLGVKISKKEPAFENELSILQILNHKNIVGLYACSFDPKTENHILVMELANGTLDDYVENYVPSVSRRKWCFDVIAALNYLHTSLENTVLHCDLKHSNILVFNLFSE